MALSVPSIGDRKRTVAIVVGITLLALVLRFGVLGGRTAHWDEARVGFWTLDYMQTGNVSYKPIIHGPFYHHVNPTLFDWFGITDTAMRIAPALITGLLPLTALLFRDRLRRVEMAALGLFLAADPVFLYYSRFMRGDPLVAAFMFAGFAFFVRAIDTKRGRHVFIGTVLIALGFTTKENALVYVMSWIGALVLLFDQRLLIAHQDGRQWFSGIWEGISALGRHVIHWWKGLLTGPIAFFLVIIYFYAPRVNGKFNVKGGGAGGEAVQVDTIGLLTDPTLIPPFVREATVGSFQKFFQLWGNGSMSEHAYLPYFFDLFGTVVHSSAAVCLFALLGLLATRYGTDNRKRSGLVLFAVLWGVSSMFVYPIITDIKAPWAAVHVVLPLVLPAAIGVSVLIREGYAAIDTSTTERSTDHPSVADGGKESRGLFGGLRAVIIVVILLIATVQIGLVGFNDVYLSPQSPDNALVQYAQPTDDLHPTMSKIEAIAGENTGTDVVVYSPTYATNPLVGGDPIYQKPSCLGTKGWFNSLPLPWYLVRSDASVACIKNQSALEQHENEQGKPPVIIAKANHTAGGGNAKPVVPNELKERYPAYEATIHRTRTTDQDIVFLIERDRVSQKPELENPYLPAPLTMGYERIVS